MIKTKICKMVNDYCDFKLHVTQTQFDNAWPHIRKCRTCTMNLASLIYVLGGKQKAMKFLGVKR